ncbi:hypothetical protein CAPTEDRAFT_90759 [Capitella teleta]|uniref:ABC-type glutathione-S-conjugate transporter n=1 Tax=Capitella teleta TaxID=283909 RepID=R7TDS4_CAPTE|nr:hypothetical protein CAPTEDRAFT_90759 [Capitella teleta]|eukprot:ELT91662.1 hypothetical protein CAPTEDRAFT_90759 [Capitella teleta]
MVFVQVFEFALLVSILPGNCVEIRCHTVPVSQSPNPKVSIHKTSYDVYGFSFRLLIGYLNDPLAPTWRGVLFAACLFFNNSITAILIHWWVYYGYLVGQRVRSVINSLVYKKAIRLSSIARRSTSVGEVVNLMSIDAQKLQDCPQFMSILWSFPIIVFFSTYFLYQTLGPASLASIPLLVCLLPFNSMYLGNKIRKYQESQMILKDERVKVMNEIISGIKVLKFYAWEPSFLKKTLDIREKELNFLQKIAYCNGVGSILWFLSPYLASLAVFAVYVCTGEDHALTPDKAFVSMSLINILNFPIALLPLAVSSVGQGLVSMRRIAKFLLLDEIEQDLNSYHEDELDDDEVIRIKDSSCSWGNDEPILKGINLSVKRGELVAVVGQVGAGKSSLLSSILGEMVTCEGSIKMKGKLAYVPQQAWIQNTSLRENILFGQDMASSQYSSVIEACALEPDLKILPGGDSIEIGEKGINLSGGQKQRVSLARAVYQDADVYLLDDPLSAVDANVGQHIFQKVIGPDGLLRNKTRILNTHGIGYLPHVDQIVVMKDGKVSEIGTYAELIENQGAFAEFITNFADESNGWCEAVCVINSCCINRKPATVQRRFILVRPGLSSHRSSLVRPASSVGGGDLLPNTELIADETAETGNVSLDVIGTYIKAGTWKAFMIVVACQVLYIIVYVLLNSWLSAWTNEPVINGTMNPETVKYRLGIYGTFGVMQVAIVGLQAFTIALGCVQASRVLHSQVLHRILKAPMSFFDTTPLGRILNRFSKDLDIVDASLPTYIRFWLFDVAPLCSTICIIAITTPIFLLILVPIGPLYIFILRLAVVNINQLRRLDSVKRSPIYAHFDESIVGLTSIRAYKKEEEFIKKCDKLIDDSQRAWFLYHITCRWIGVWVEILGSFLVFIAALLSILQRDTLSAGQAGLSITFSLQLILFLNVSIRASAELETYIVSVERIKEYTQVPQEALWDVPETKPPADWPRDGKIVIKNYSTRYRPGLDLVLKRISCVFNPRERVGIVGRTGAGKSSLTLSLFRIIESASGSISIDDVAIHAIGLHDLRRGLTIIPQDPVLFSGTLRQNLDPFQNHEELDMWAALEHAHLKSFVKETSNGLEYDVGDGGESLSIGQRQLVCLARALLHKTRVLILDEATAAVDMETDELIQTTIRSRFTDCTIITIAHRLNTVLDYDRIAVFDQGKIVEMDSPTNLLRKRNSLFRKMAKDAGIS